ncbi:hypothetical protein N2152v2_005042 [Parachlorella kessleri]
MAGSARQRSEAREKQTKAKDAVHPQLSQYRATGQQGPCVEGTAFPAHTSKEVVSPDHTTFDLLDIDSYTESIRKDLRTVFDHDRWVAHRSPSRYLRHTLGLFQSRMLLGMAPPLLYVLGVATFVCGYQNAFKISFGQLGQLLGLTAFALSLLLVFRTNASYERWDSARKMWGLVLNRSRDLVRQARARLLGLAWIPKERTKLRAMLCRWVPAFGKTMMCHLRRDEDLEKELKGILQPHEIAGVLNATHRPIYALQVLTEIVKAARLPTAVTTAMEGNLVTFEDSLGGCERILRTPIPLSYATHTSRFMIMWLTLLPFTLYSTLGWGTIPVCGIVAFLLLGIKEITVSIEEPFSILALETITNTIFTNVMELQSVHDTQLDSGNGNGNGNSNGNGKPAAVPASALVALAEDEGNGPLPLGLAAVMAN